MRKDVKFGLAVGGVLLAVLVAYVLFVPPPNTTTVDVPKDTPAAPTDSGNSNNNNVVADRGTDRTADRGTDRAADRAPAPTTVPSDPAVTMTPPPTDVWGALLTRGPEAVRDTSRDARDTTTPDPFRSSGDTRTPPDGASVTMTPTPATRPAGAKGEHIVQKGETLISIATAEYGKPESWQQIAKANPSVDPKHLKVGTRLVLPKAEAEKPVPAPAPADSRTADSARSTPTPAAPNTHTVAKGDTLYTISVAHFGTTAKWEKIYDLNKATIGADPAKLKIGMVLKLPDREASPAAAATPVAGTH